MGKSLDGSPVRHLTIYFFLAQRCIQLKLRALQTITISFVSLTRGGGGYLWQITQLFYKWTV